MSFIYGLQSTRNSFLFRFNLLVSWRKRNSLAVTLAGCRQFQNLSLVNKNQGLTSFTWCDRLTFLRGNSHINRTFDNRRPECFSHAKSKDMWVITHNCTSRNDSFPRWVLTKEGAVAPALPPALAAWCPVPCSLVRSARNFHTSPRIQAAPIPLLLVLLKPLQKLLAIIVGRVLLCSPRLVFNSLYSQTSLKLMTVLLPQPPKCWDYRGIRKWWQALPPNKKELFRESVRRNKWKLFLGLSTCGLLFVMFYCTHLEVSPITGRKKLLLLGKEHFKILSELEYKAWMEEFKNDMLTEKDPRHLAVKEVVYHLVECNKDIPEISEINWIIHVVDSPTIINAFVLPNGQVFVFTGLLNSVTDTHQLSFLLGHEIAHAILGHAAEKASMAHLLDFLGMIFLTMIWAICPRDSLAILGQWVQSKLQEYMFDRPYNRTLETEADKIGLQLAAKACVDVRASSVFWQQMEITDILHGHPKLPEWLSTHPSHGNRAEHLDSLIPEALKIREFCNCPPLSGPDPRLLFKLSMKNFCEELEKDRNTTFKQQKMDPLPTQKQEQIPLTYVVEKQTGS